MEWLTPSVAVVAALLFVGLEFAARYFGYRAASQVFGRADGQD